MDILLNWFKDYDTIVINAMLDGTHGGLYAISVKKKIKINEELRKLFRALSYLQNI